MSYLKFVSLFTIIHVIAYTLAGSLALKISKDIYESRGRVCTFLRDMGDKEESLHVTKYFLPAQLLRGVLMGVVLLPVLSKILDMTIVGRILFLSGIMFVYSHIAAASAFIDNIEGLVYFKRKYIGIKSFLKFQFEMVLYTLIFSTSLSWIIEVLS